MTDNSRPDLPSLSKFAAALGDRLGARGELLTVAGIGLLALIVLTALPLGSGLLAFGVVLAYVLARAPREPTGSVERQRRSRQTSDLASEQQALVEAMPDPAWILDASSLVLYANLPARGVFPSLRTGINVASAVRNPELIEAVERALATGTVQSTMLHQRVPIERRLAVVAAPLQVESAEPRASALLVTLRDLTEQDRLAQMRADFVANASHELRMPLASLRGFVETLQGPARNDPVARERFLAIMSVQAERMTRLIDDLLSLSRVEMRLHLAPTAIVDLAELVPQAIQGLEPQAAQAKVKLAFETEGRPMPVRGDRDELLQVLQNLIQNGIKYGREGGTVDVQLRRSERAVGKPWRIELVVRDDGPGIAAEHIPRLTERFYRVSAPQSRDKGGTGLGLAIVKHIVSRHGGELQIASKVGEGSSFAVVLDEVKEM